MPAEIRINESRVIRYFMELASISSPSWKEDEVIAYIESFARRKNLTVAKYPCRKSYNLLLTLPPNDPSRETLLFAAHMDTVVPCANIKVIDAGSRITSDGTTILGGDDKAALAAFLEVIEHLTETGKPHGKLEFLFTCAEEVGLCGMKGMEFDALSAKKAFVLDSGGPVGLACVKAPYQISMKVKIKGKASHAGMYPEKGKSAIYALAAIVNALPQGRLDADTTTNVGIISGGKANNIVAEDASFELECRSTDRKKLDRLVLKIKSAIRTTAAKRKVKAQVEYQLEYSGYSFTKSDGIIKHFQKAARHIGLKSSLKSSGGGSDTNILNHHGIQALNLAVGMADVHTTHEYIEKKDIYSSTRLIISIIENS